MARVGVSGHSPCLTQPRAGVHKVLCSVPDPNPSIIKQNSKKVLENPWFLILRFLYDFLSFLKNDVNVLRKVITKIYFFLVSWRSLTKRAGSGSGSGSVGQRYGSEDPDPYSKVTDPEQCLILWDLNQTTRHLVSVVVTGFNGVHRSESRRAKMHPKI